MMDTNALDELITKFDAVNDDTIPGWALILIKGIKELTVQLKNLNNLNERIQHLEDFKTVTENTSKRLQDDNVRLNDVITALEEKVEDHEQRSRNQCLLFHGVDEQDNEDTDKLVLNIINNDLGLRGISIDSLQRSHRLGPKKQQRQTRSTPKRPIIVKFVSFRDRQGVFKEKKKLKGQMLSISENLTKKRYELYQAAITTYGRMKVWTNEGRIMTKLNDQYKTIRNMGDLEQE